MNLCQIMLQLLLWAPLALANPLRLDLKLQVEVLEPEVQTAPLTAHREHKADSLGQNAGSLASDLPVVNLPYEKHKASPQLSDDQKFYNFSNIPYAQQPIGDLRFKAAKAIEDVKGDLPTNDGQKYAICPQAQVGWVPYAEDFLKDYYQFNDKLANKWSYPITPKDNYTWTKDVEPVIGMDEACLTLDVMVPKRIYDKRADNDGYDAPVMVWFFGGGYVFGSKTFFGSPAGLFESALAVEDVVEEDFIFVGVNYRLGAFGWLAGDTFEKAGGYENAGLSDQVAALDWVEKNIEKFGGNPREVTVVGESAGASSIMQHLVSYGGAKNRLSKPSPKFKRAIMQSPALFPVTDRLKMDNVYKAFLKEVGANDFAGLLKADTKDLIRANSKTSYESPYGQFNYGPVVDDEYIQAPAHILARFGFLWPMDIMISYNRAEGLLFTPPWVRSESDLRKYILDAYPEFMTEELDFALRDLYPFGKDLSATAAVNATSQLLGDFAVTSNVFGFIRKSRVVYEYLFNFFPGIHGQDGKYTFGPTGDTTINKEQRQRMQRYITSFVKWGNPNAAKLDDDSDFEEYWYEKKHMQFGSAKLLSATDTFYQMEPDILNSTRCEFWQNAPYWDPPNPISGLRDQADDRLSQAHLEI